MKNNKKNQNLTTYYLLRTTGGYALLFTMVILSIVSAIATGVSNTMYKSSLLSSTARESQIAFYEADTAIECGIYATEVDLLVNITSGWNCGINKAGSALSFTKSSPMAKQYLLEPSSLTVGPCFKMFIDKTDPTKSVIQGRGYNVCDTLDPRLVERGLEIYY